MPLVYDELRRPAARNLAGELFGKTLDATGLVFVAEQLRPVRRQVAIKIVKPGMDTRDVVARFDAERQALAMMDQEANRLVRWESRIFACGNQ